jgi:hypothetical protein
MDLPERIRREDSKSMHDHCTVILEVFSCPMLKRLCKIRDADIKVQGGLPHGESSYCGFEPVAEGGDFLLGYAVPARHERASS